MLKGVGSKGCCLWGAGVVTVIWLIVTELLSGFGGSPLNCFSPSADCPHYLFFSGW